MRMQQTALLAGAMAMAGCTTTGDGTGATTPSDKECNTANVQSFIGQRATAEIGQDMLRASGARQLRWAPPNSAVTLDFRSDRLTVSYDDDMLIEQVSCG